MAIQSNFPAIRPTLDLNFASSRTVDPRITFTRASTATYFDEFGVMRTVPANSPRIDFDPVTGECKGLLLEEQRTNLLLNSATLATQNITVTAVAHTLTFYGTGTVTLSGAATGVLVGTGAANRVALTFTPAAGTLTVTVSGTCSQAQLEVGSFPTSYIPTTTAQATRATDIAVMTGSNFSGWYNQSEGTLFADYILGADNSSCGLFHISDGTSSNVIAMRYAAVTQIQYTVSVNGVLQANLTSSGYSTPGKYKRAANYVNNIFEQAINGVLPSGVDTIGAVPLVNTLTIGAESAAGVSSLNGHIVRLSYYPKALSSANLQAITT